MRLTAPELVGAYREGMCGEGATVLDAGEVGHRDALLPGRLAGARRRADVHRLAQPQGATPAPSSSGAARSRCRATPASATIRERIEAGLGDAPGGGSVEEVDVYDEFQEAALEFIDPGAIKPLKVVVDGGNGMAGPMVGPLLERLGLDLVEAYWEPDGNFPDHEPNPLLPENREFIMREVVAPGRRPRDRLGRRRRPLLLHRRARARSSTATS